MFSDRNGEFDKNRTPLKCDSGRAMTFWCFSSEIENSDSTLCHPFNNSLSFRINFVDRWYEILNSSGEMILSDHPSEYGLHSTNLSNKSLSCVCFCWIWSLQRLLIADCGLRL
jgi:hypothetical protein